jgi:formylglycine-generating enzyme required for sulfatase activity/tRNA A-37 threonylcarbamoyl transferase component Bud32
MHTQSVQDFLDSLLASHLVDEEQLEKLPHDNANPEELARQLTERGLLTPYQAERLLEDGGQELRLGSYLVLERLGKGGMGDVFKARHQNLQRLAAVKVIRPEHLNHPDSVLRFRREAQAAARLHHPNIVTIYDADRAGNTHFLAMEYVPGTDLGRLVKKHGPLPPAMACEFVRQAALGLEHACEQGLVHRDIKPQNLMVTRSAPGRPAVVKITDFGLARFASEGTDEAGLTPTGQWMGTPEFIAPEQARDSKSADIRADIFSLGCTLFRLLTGESAFPGQTSADKISARLVGDAVPLRSLKPQTDPALEAVLMRMMARDVAARFQTPAEVAEALLPFCQGAAELEIRFGESGGSSATDKESAGTGPGIPDTVTAAKTPRPAAVSTGQGTVQAPTAVGEGIVSPPPRWPRRAWPFALGAGLAAVGLILASFWNWHNVPDAETDPRDRNQIPPPVRKSDPFFTNSLGMKLAKIPGAKFLMGSPPGEVGRTDSEGPQHPVVIAKSFYLGVYEVTQDEYQKLMGLNPSHFSASGEGRKLVEGKDTRRYPVERVSWNEAKTFCRLLSKQPDEQKAGRVYRLPTEAEWEYACRAGTTGPFSFGDSLSAFQANFDGGRPYGNAPPGPRRWHTLPVGSFPPNGFGLYDMHGNVFEWCEDYNESSYADNLNHVQRKHRPEDDRVLRGGAWMFASSACRSAARFGRFPSDHSNYAGFRVACDLLLQREP